MIRRCLLLFLSVCLAGCAGLSGEPAIVATAPPPAASTHGDATPSWQPDIVSGARVFAEHCADCHGSSGDGRGELAVGGSVPQPIDMRNRAEVAAKSPLEWYEIITAGKIENLMPPWQNALSDQERWNVALYSYTLGYSDELLGRGERLWAERCAGCALPQVIAPVYSDVEFGLQLRQADFAPPLSRDEVAAAVAFARMRSLDKADAEPIDAAAGPISGRVEHGTSGGLVPPDTVVRLEYGNSASGIATAETIVAADGSFTFERIPLRSDFTTVVSAAYDGRRFHTRLPASLRDDGAATITLYDAANDHGAVSVARIEILLDAVDLDELERALHVRQIISYRNDSDRLYTSGRGFDDGREAVLLAQFPRGAQILSGDGGGRYVVIEGVENLPDSVIDTVAVMPGDGHELALEYYLAYDDGLRFEQEFNNALDAEVQVVLDAGLRLESEGFQRADAGAVRSVYSAQLKQEREPRLSFVISGDPFATGSESQAVVTGDSLRAIAIAGGALAAALGAGFVGLRRRRSSAGDDIESLIGQLARLDADHESGQLNHDLWHHKRRALKAKLAALMAERGQ